MAVDSPTGILSTLGYMLTLNDGVAAPPGGGPPRAGVTTTMQNGLAEQQGPAIPEIYVGTTTNSSPDDTPKGFGSQSTTTDHTVPMTDLIEKFTKMSAAQQRQMAILLSIAGYTESLTSTGSGASSLETAVKNGYEMSQFEVVNAYQNLLNETAMRYAVWDKKITPEQVLREGISFRLPVGVTWDGDFNSLPVALAESGLEIPGLTAVVEGEGKEEDDGKGKKVLPFEGTKTTTYTSVDRDIMDPADAKALTRAMLQRELGRDPTEDEFDDFISAIQYAQKVNPSKTTTTQSETFERDKQSFGGNRMVSQHTNTTTRAGITEAGLTDIALQKARQNPNWAEWQAVGTYAPALFEALGATVAGR
jgi:hypothetical protein